jgi:hypothetical protein
VPLGGANGIAVDAAGADLGSPPPLDGIIEPDHNWVGGWQEGRDQQQEKSARCGAGRPRGAAENAVEGAETGIALAPQNAQRRRDGASARRQDDAGEQHQDVWPGRPREQIGKLREDEEKAFRERIEGGQKARGVLHPMRRVDALNRNNPAALRQIESEI